MRFSSKEKTVNTLFHNKKYIHCMQSLHIQIGLAIGALALGWYQYILRFRELSAWSICVQLESVSKPNFPMGLYLEYLHMYIYIYTVRNKIIPMTLIFPCNGVVFAGTLHAVNSIEFNANVKIAFKKNWSFKIHQLYNRYRL